MQHTVLQSACEKGYTEIVELLLKHDRVHVNVTDKDSVSDIPCSAKFLRACKFCEFA